MLPPDAPSSPMAMPPLVDLAEIANDEAAADIFADILIATPVQQHQPGDLVGRYTLLEKLGDGGFGTVWRAGQAVPVKREVALKILKLGMDTLEVMGRFEQERQALALMEHPNIAKVLDAGATAEGRPFFVMELVRGVPLTTYCLEKQLPLEQRLTLMREVCAGVQHAHQKGIIHRDLKPSNILVTEIDGAPVPKIIDFGIAKATTTDKLTEFTLMTRVNQFIGTPLYMSPEQADASADIDTRTDVYALGALLYELLTGQPPFDAKTLLAAGHEEMRRIIREQQPPPPSRRSLSPKSKDLDLITLRALEKDRARRYESATALGEDIQRFLNHEPVLAHAPSTLYLLRRWGRRHRVLAVAASLILLVILAGGGTTYWQKLEAQNQAREADAMLEIMLDTITRTDSTQAKTYQLKDILDSIAEKSAGQTNQSVRQGRLDLALGRAYEGLVETDKAEGYLRKAREIAQHTPGLERMGLQARLHLAKCAGDATRYQEQLDGLTTLVADCEHQLGPMDRITIENHVHHAQALVQCNRAREGLAELDAMLDRLKQAPQTMLIQRIVAYVQYAYPDTAAKAGKLEKAMSAGHGATDMTAAVHGADSSPAAFALQEQGLAAGQAGDWQEAIQCFQKAWEIFTEAYGPDSRHALANENRLVEIQQKLGLVDDMITTQRFCVDKLSLKLGPAAPETVAQIASMLTSMEAAGRYTQARSELKGWLPQFRKADGSWPKEATYCVCDFLLAVGEREGWNVAEATAQEQLAIAKHQDPPAAWMDAAEGVLALSMAKQGRYAEATTLAEAILEAHQTPTPATAGLPKSTGGVSLDMAMTALLEAHRHFRQTEKAESLITQWKQNYRLPAGGYSKEGTECLRLLNDYYFALCRDLKDEPTGRSWISRHEQAARDWLANLQAYESNNPRIPLVKRLVADAMLAQGTGRINEVVELAGQSVHTLENGREFSSDLKSVWLPRSKATLGAAREAQANSLMVTNHGPQAEAMLLKLIETETPRQPDGTYPLEAERWFTLLCHYYVNYEMWDKALPAARTVVEVRKQGWPGVWRIDSANVYLADALLHTGSPAEALPLAEAALPALEKNRAQFPTIEHMWLPLTHQIIDQAKKDLAKK